MTILQDLLEQRKKITRAQQRAFARQINGLIRRTGKLERTKVDEMLRLLQRSKADVQDTLLSFPKGTFSRSMGAVLKAEIERLMRRFEGEASEKLKQAQREFAVLGQDFNDALIKSQGGRIPPLGISPEIVENAATRSADLIRSLSQRQVGRASDLINRGVITGKSVFEVAQDMGKEFNKGLAQMETIARTETLGIHSQVQMAQLLEFEKLNPGLQKQWITVRDGRQRDDHDEAHLQLQPVKEPFQVGRDKLQFPRDPGGPAAQIINCRCTMVPDFSQVRDEEPLGLAEMPPPEAKLGSLAQKVAQNVKKGFKNLR